MNKAPQAITTALLTAITVYLNQLSMPFLVLVIVMLVDYITGLIKAQLKGGLSSKIGIKGIIKKFSYIILVFVGVVIDYTIKYVIPNYEYSIIFSVLITFWLITNELISITENLYIIGVPVPKFVTSIIKKLKIKIEGDSKNE